MPCDDKFFAQPTGSRFLTCSQMDFFQIEMQKKIKYTSNGVEMSVSLSTKGNAG